MVFVCVKCKRDVDTPGLFCPYCGTPAPAPESDATDPFIGRTLGSKYFVNQRLGRGGMGLVYRATDLVLDRPVALKLLNRSLLSDPSMVQRFHREGRAASRLNHPNCITILEFGQTEDEPLFIAMEYLAGRPLSRLLAEEAPLEQGRVARIVAQILSALAEAHASGVIHRDLKLSNVMVEARRDEPDFVKVLDFGIAKLTEPGEGAGQLTGTGVVCGTPGYMSPEQARGEELDARSDLYAVGVILYELLSGRLPFESETPLGFVAKHLSEVPTPLRARRPDLDIAPDLEALVGRALAKDRSERPASAEAMREELLACRLPAGGSERRTPRPERSATVILPASRPDSGSRLSPSPASARSSPPPQSSPVVWSPPGATGSTGSGLPEPVAPKAEPPRGPTPRPARMMASVSVPVDGAEAVVAPSAEPPPKTRAAPSPRAVPRPGQRVKWVAAGGGALLVALVLFGLLRSDPFAAAAAPPADLDAGLRLAASPGTSLAARPVAQAPVDGAPEAGAAGSPAQAPLQDAQPSPGPSSPVAAPAPQPQPAAAAAPAPAPAPAAAPPPLAATPPAARARKGAGVLEEAEGLNVLKAPAAATGQGVLAVTASPWGVVSVDGRELGETPREIRAAGGFYRIKVAHPTLGAMERSVVVVAGRRVVFNVPLSKQGGR